MKNILKIIFGNPLACTKWKTGEGFFVGSRNGIDVLCYHKNALKVQNVGLDIFQLLKPHQNNYRGSVIFYDEDQQVIRVNEVPGLT